MRRVGDGIGDAILVPADTFVFDGIFEAVLVLVETGGAGFTSTKMTSSMCWASMPLKMRKSIGAPMCGL